MLLAEREGNRLPAELGFGVLYAEPGMNARLLCPVPPHVNR